MDIAKGYVPCDRICGLVVRVPGLQIKRSGFDLERGPLNLVNAIDELLERKK
jgi:hypothetical protein